MRTKLSNDIASWRELQSSVMVDVDASLVTSEKAGSIEDAQLWLPSQYTLDQRVAFNLTELANHELSLREGQAFESLRETQMAMQMLAAMRARKLKHSRGVDANTRSEAMIKSGCQTVSFHMAAYNRAREAMITLSDNAQLLTARFPRLEKADTFLRSSELKTMATGIHHRANTMFPGLVSTNQIAHPGRGNERTPSFGTQMAVRSSEIRLNVMSKL